MAVLVPRSALGAEDSSKLYVVQQFETNLQCLFNNPNEYCQLCQNRGVECGEKTFASESQGNNRKRRCMPGESIIHWDENSRVDSCPMTPNAENQASTRVDLNFLTKQFTAKLENYEQLGKELRHKLHQILEIVSQSGREPIGCDRVPCSSHISPRGVRNPGGRPRGYSTFGNRGTHRSVRGRRQNKASAMDYTGGSHVGPTQPLDPIQESLIQTSVSVAPGIYLHFVFNLFSSVWDWACSSDNFRYYLFAKSYFAGQDCHLRGSWLDIVKNGAGRASQMRLQCNAQV